MSAYSKNYSIQFPNGTYGRSWIEGFDPTPGYTATTRVVTAVRTLDGVRNPNWRQQVSKGQDATTPVTATWDSVEYPAKVSFSQKWKNANQPTYKGRKEMFGDFALTNSIAFFSAANPTVSPNFVDNLARAAFYSKLSKISTKFQGQVFLGEMRETLHMLRRPAVGLRNLASDFLGTLRKRKRANPKSWSRDIGSIWLEQAFGWRPLINDIKDAVDAYEHLTKPRDETIRVSAGASKSYDSSGAGLTSFERAGGTIVNPNSSQLRFIVTYGLLREHVIVRYRGGVRPLIKAPGWRNAELFGFSPENFVPSLWELLPWSFLIDYFSNIGDLLTAYGTWSVTQTYASKSIIQTTEKHRRLKWDDTYKAPFSGSEWSIESSSGPSQLVQLIRRKRFTRSQVGTVPMPTLQFNFDLSDGQLLNIAALLTQAGALHPQNSPRPYRR